LLISIIIISWTVNRLIYDPAKHATVRTMVVLINPMGKMQVKKVSTGKLSGLQKSLYKKMSNELLDRYTKVINEYNQKKPKLTFNTMLQDCIKDCDSGVIKLSKKKKQGAAATLASAANASNTIGTPQTPTSAASGADTITIAPAPPVEEEPKAQEAQEPVPLE